MKSTGMGKELAALLLAAATVGGVIEARAAGAELQVTAQAAVVMDARTGALLWSRNPDEPRPPASTTKILTAVLALESGRLEQTFRVSAQAQAQVPSKLYLRAGQSAKLRDLVYALMLKSANDAAVVVAEGLSGSVERFAKRMTERARSMGARVSQFRNPSGLPDDEHLSTARDLGMILRHAIHVPGFTQVASVTSQRIPISVGGKPQQKWMVLRTKNRLLQGYSVPVIGKTGYTRAAGRCFAGYAQKDGRSLIVVVLGSADLWEDTRQLFDWGFDQQHEAPLPVPVQVAARPVERVAFLPAKESSPAPRKPAAKAEEPARQAKPMPAPVEVPPVVAVALPAGLVPPARVAKVPEAPLEPSAPAKEERDRQAAGASNRARSVATASAARAEEKKKEEGYARVTLAMGNGSSRSSGQTYYGEYKSRSGMVRRGCSGSGCESAGTAGGRR
jgi:D-alanyl-D-alanine carboxypeptidase